MRRTLSFAFAAAALLLAQAPTPLVARIVETPETPADVLFADVDGDGRSDLVTTASGRRIFARLRAKDGGFASPIVAVLPPWSTGVVFATGKDGALRLALGGAEAGKSSGLALADFGPPPLAEGNLSAAAPTVLGFAEDLDGEGGGDVVFPDDEGATIRFANGRTCRLAPPIERVRTAGRGGLVAETTRFPRTTFVRLEPGAPPRPCWFDRGALHALQGSFAAGFGPGSDELVRFADEGPPAERVLERNEARLHDLDGDGRPEAVLVRTRTKAGALAGARTELIFRRLGESSGPPLMALVLPGVLSNGPDFTDLDGDGRAELWLSVFGDDLQSRVARGLRGVVKLTYFAYRAGEEGHPFRRSPSFTLEDDVPVADFDAWPLRHRYLPDQDWTGDGRKDLVVFKSEAAGATFEIRVAAPPGAGGALSFAERPRFALRLPFPLADCRPWALSATEPALLCRAAGKVVVVSAR